MTMENYDYAHGAYSSGLRHGFNELEQKIACMDPELAYKYAKFVVGADVKYCQPFACDDPCWAYYFARDVKGADIEYCMKAACKDPRYAWFFALRIPGADIEYCKAHMGEWLDDFLQNEMRNALR